MGKPALPRGPPASLPPDKPWQGPCPFKEGDLVESRAFTEGFRDAWFVCRVLAVKEAPGPAAFELTLKCVDFDEDDPFQCQLYERNPGVSEPTWELMLRPLPPDASHPPSKLDGGGAFESRLGYRIQRSYAIGDAVEYLCNFGRWAGRISELSEEHAAVWWRPPPHGEGGEECNIPLKLLRPAMVWDRGQWSFPGHPYGPLGTLTGCPVEGKPGAQKATAAKLKKPGKVGRPALNQEALEGPPGTVQGMQRRRKAGHRERENAKLPPFCWSLNTQLSPAERISVARKALEGSEADADLDVLEDAIRTILGCRPRAYPKKGYLYKVARYREFLTNYADPGRPSGGAGNGKGNANGSGAGSGKGDGNGNTTGSGAGNGKGDGNGNGNESGAANGNGDGDGNGHIKGNGFRKGNESGATKGNGGENRNGNGNGDRNGNVYGLGKVQPVHGAPKRKVTPKRLPAAKRKSAGGTGVKRGLESAFEEEESSPGESDDDFFFGPVDIGEAASGGTPATDGWGISPEGISGFVKRVQRRVNRPGKSLGQDSGVDSPTAGGRRGALSADSAVITKGSTGSAKGMEQPRSAGKKAVLPPFSKDSLNTRLSRQKRSEIARRTLAECTDRADLGRLEDAIRTVLACRPPNDAKKGAAFKVAHLRKILARYAKTGRASHVPRKAAGRSEAPGGLSPGGTKAASGSAAPGLTSPGGTWRVWTKRAAEGKAVESRTPDSSVRPQLAPRSGGAAPAESERARADELTRGSVNKPLEGSSHPGGSGENKHLGRTERMRIARDALERHTRDHNVRTLETALRRVMARPPPFLKQSAQLKAARWRELLARCAKTGEVRFVSGAPKPKVTPERKFTPKQKITPKRKVAPAKRKSAAKPGVKRGLESAFRGQSLGNSDAEVLFGPVELGGAASGGAPATDGLFGTSPGTVPGPADQSQRQGDGSGVSPRPVLSATPGIAGYGPIGNVQTEEPTSPFPGGGWFSSPPYPPQEGLDLPH